MFRSWSKVFQIEMEIPRQIATLHGFLTMCHYTTNSCLPRGVHGGGVYFGDESRARLKPHHHPRVNSKLASRHSIKRQVGRQVSDTSVHTLKTEPPSRQCLAAFIFPVMVLVDRLENMQMMISVPYFGTIKANS